VAEVVLPLNTSVGWGPYPTAIARWEEVLGTPAPDPKDSKGRLAPEFVEWMQGLPAGWVTGIPGPSRNDVLRILGNGVVSQQCAAVLAELLPIWAAVIIEARAS
jgi:DNA (cytosine-5)-methyltransferase 1